MPTEGELNTLRFFHYYPSVPLAIVSLVIYILLSLALLFRVYATKSRKFLYILGITGLFECIGYVFRLLSAKNTTLGTYIGMSLFLLLPPNALALVNYKATGEMIRLSGVPASRFWLKPKFVTWFFFSSDIFSFLLQGSGGGLQAMSAEKAALGKTITLIGLIVQLFFFGSFAFITIHVHRSPKYQYTVIGQTNPKRKLSICLYITLILLYVRSIYRIAEYAGGYDGVIATTEWAFYVFDTLIIAIAFVVYYVIFIGNYLPKRNEEELQVKSTRVNSSSSSVDINHLERGENPEGMRLYQVKK
ncbi:unnamed protein product [Mucor fragilis]